MCNNIINSVLDKNSQAKLVESILVDDLISEYEKHLKIDVSNYFLHVEKIGVYECLSTKFRFYYPFTIGGDSSFYEQLQSYDWYYMPWKWEHETTLNFLNKNDKILEVGSGGLGFIETLQSKGMDVTGLELNEDSIIKSKRIGLKVFNESVQDHALKNPGKYDLVCSYQVLEHISEVYSFIKAKLDCLKTGGKLIIAVPNNDSFIRLDGGGVLNKPPHHMGLWDKRSLKGLADIFNLRIQKICYEPLQEYHVNWYINSTINHKIAKNKLLRFILKKSKVKKVYSKLIQMFKSKIHGHTILVVFTKV